MEIDWEQLFVPSQPILEIVVRGSIVYLVIFLAMRFLPRRTIGTMGAADLLVVVLIADAVQNGMSGDYHSITEALVLAATIFGWATFIDWLDFKFPRWHIAAAKERPVIVDGKILHGNLKREQITENELLAQLRLHGQDSPRNVAKAYIEGDGSVSVILRTREHLAPVAEQRGAG
jgi:uncharacterized membrane protein YcaP (DUF421 family)